MSSDTIFGKIIRGEIPAELSGRYLRNGPNPKSGTSGHWFFGDGMVHGIRLRDGRADWYRNRYIVSDRVTEVTGKPPAHDLSRFRFDRFFDGTPMRPGPGL